MSAADELGAVLRTAEALAAGEQSRQVTLPHLAQALLRSAQGAPPEPEAGPPPVWSPAAAGAVARAARFATAEGAEMAARRHLAAALGEIVNIRDMLAGEAPFIDHLPARTPEGGITYEMKATVRLRPPGVRRREPGEPG